MKERPILFNTPMVRAILDDSKTQTRRLVKPSHAFATKFRGPDGEGGILFDAAYRCPFGGAGDRLWVRETHEVIVVGTELFHGDRRVDGYRHYAKIAYRADDGRAEVDIDDSTFERLDDSESKGWTPSIHMPRWASRITLEVTGVHVERLNAISDADAAAEGIESLRGEGVYWKDYQRSTASVDELVCTSARDSFRTLWDSLAPAGADWAANPWVWVVEFRRS